MTISIFNPVQATWIFSAILAVALLVSIKKRKTPGLFPLELTQQLKGVAILAVVLSHVGYFLVTDHRFMFPLSVMAGVGVNLFLFLSGYGLTAGGLKKDLSIWQFYRRRLPKLFIPFWVVMVIFLLMDFLILHKTYPLDFLLKAVFGVFTHADLYNDLNSPLWYITLTVFYYILFPLVFNKKYSWLSALALYGISFGIVSLEPDVFARVMFLYRTHIMAFPLGMIFAWLFIAKPDWAKAAAVDIKNFFGEKAWPILRYMIMSALIFIICYTAYYSGVGETATKEQLISLTTVLSFLALFMLVRTEVRLLSIFGIFSYEIYLLHWPIMYRYDILFKNLPAWLAMSIYLAVFIGLGWLLQLGLERLKRART